MVDPTKKRTGGVKERGGEGKEKAELSRSWPSAFIVFGAAEHANMLKLCNCD